MKTIVAGLTGLALSLSVPGEVMAAQAADSYAGGALIGTFIGFCALLVVIQMVPTLLLLIGTFRSLCKKDSAERMANGIGLRQR